jgi:short-subunit dehydrogenase
MQRYDGKIAVVTGASSGIGRRVARDLAARGATVVGLARRAELLAELAPECSTASPAWETRVCDVADVDAFRARLADVESRHGRVDVLINNAGVHEATPVTEEPDFDAFTRIMATNYFAPVAGTLAVLPGMVRRGAGIVVNVSSDSARAPEPRGSGYAASKAALSTFTESVAIEASAAAPGVHVHVLYPAWVPTAMGTAGGGPPPPKPVRRTEEQVSNLLLERMGRGVVEINAAWLPKLAVIGRAVVPRAYEWGMRHFATAPTDWH